MRVCDRCIVRLVIQHRRNTMHIYREPALGETFSKVLLQLAVPAGGVEIERKYTTALASLCSAYS